MTAAVIPTGFLVYALGIHSASKDDGQGAVGLRWGSLRTHPAARSAATEALASITQSLGDLPEDYSAWQKLLQGLLNGSAP
eukprot:2870109-Alexandrium_andersonii.AAC.1